MAKSTDESKAAHKNGPPLGRTPRMDELFPQNGPPCRPRMDEQYAQCCQKRHRAIHESFLTLNEVVGWAPRRNGQSGGKPLIRLHILTSDSLVAEQISAGFDDTYHGPDWGLNKGEVWTFELPIFVRDAIQRLTPNAAPTAEQAKLPNGMGLMPPPKKMYYIVREAIDGIDPFYVPMANPNDVRCAGGDFLDQRGGGRQDVGATLPRTVEELECLDLTEDARPQDKCGGGSQDHHGQGAGTISELPTKTISEDFTILPTLRATPQQMAAASPPSIEEKPMPMSSQTEKPTSGLSRFCDDSPGLSRFCDAQKPELKVTPKPKKRNWKLKEPIALSSEEGERRYQQWLRAQSAGNARSCAALGQEMKVVMEPKKEENSARAQAREATLAQLKETRKILTDVTTTLRRRKMEEKATSGGLEPYYLLRSVPHDFIMRGDGKRTRLSDTPVLSEIIGGPAPKRDNGYTSDGQGTQDIMAVSGSAGGDSPSFNESQIIGDGDTLVL